MMRRKVKQLFAAGMALAVLATNLTPLSFAAEQPDAEPAAAASGDMYDADAILDLPTDWEYIGCSWSSDYATATFNYRVEKNGHEKSVTVDSTKSEKSPTCTKDGQILYTATVHFWDAPNGLSCTETETVEVPKLEHNYPVEPESISFKGLSDLGYEPTAVAIYECTRCGQTKTEEVTDLTYVELKKATCVEKGEGYWVASAGGRTEESALVHPGTTDHDFTKKDAAHVTFAFAENGKTADATIRCAHCDATTTETVTCTAEVTTPATCTKMGTTTYTATCGTASETTTRQDVAMADHEYSATVEWVGTDFMKGRVTYECTQCGPDDEGHFKYEDVDAVVKVVKEPTCLEDGEERHFISASIDGVEVAQKMESVKLPALGHNYNSATVDWVGTDFMKGKVTYECTRCYPGDEGHFKYEDVDAVVKVVKEPTCLEDGEERHFISASINGVEVAQKMEPVKLPALGHDCSLELEWDDDTCTSATATVKCSDCDYERDVPVTITAVRTEPTCTEIGYIDYTATADVTYDPKTEGRSPEKESAQIDGQTILPALGHSFTNYVYNGDATCDGDGTETAKCDRCDVTDTRTAVATAGCDLHTVDGAKVCAVCGKVNGQPKLAAAEANADVNASTIGVHLVVRVGTLPTGQKVITVAFLNNDGQAVQMFGTQKIHVSLAQLKAALGDTEGTGFEHTLTRVNTANGEKQNVGFTVENGTVNFDAAFNGSTACILLVD